jgi:hypothetical protein
MKRNGMTFLAVPEIHTTRRPTPLIKVFITKITLPENYATQKREMSGKGPSNGKSITLTILLLSNVPRPAMSCGLTRT